MKFNLSTLTIDKIDIVPCNIYRGSHFDIRFQQCYVESIYKPRGVVGRVARDVGKPMDLVRL